MEPHLQEVAIKIIIFIFGLLFGSFATMASYRLPRGEDLVFKPSNCPKCNHKLGFFDLFPVFSWVFSGGKCRYCKGCISISYPLIELFTATLFLITYIIFGTGLQSFCLAILCVCMVIIIVVDLEHKIIPDEIQVALLITGILYRYSIDSSWQEYIYNPLFGLMIALSLRYGFWFWKKKEGLGMGDVKFFAIVGFFIDINAFPVFLLLSGLIGIFTALLWRALGKGEEFPFGPALVISMFLCVLFPEYLIHPLYIGS